jgi:hypothetical protein
MSSFHKIVHKHHHCGKKWRIDDPDEAYYCVCGEKVVYEDGEKCVPSQCSDCRQKDILEEKMKENDEKKN